MSDCAYIAGVDEVGRGPLAGAVIAAAVILDPNQPIIGLTDSKKLSEKKREFLFDEVQLAPAMQQTGMHERGFRWPSKGFGMRPTWDFGFDRFALFVHWVKLQFDLSTLSVEENNAIAVQSISCPIHGDPVSKSIAKLARVLRSAGLSVPTGFKGFPTAAGLR